MCVSGKFKLRELALDGHMKLDRAAVRALNLFPQPQEGNRNMSLYSLLNKCKTPIGSRYSTQFTLALLVQYLTPEELRRLFMR